MRRADRLFQIIQVLRRTRKPLTADAIAAELETSLLDVGGGTKVRVVSGLALSAWLEQQDRGEITPEYAARLIRQLHGRSSAAEERLAAVEGQAHHLVVAPDKGERESHRRIRLSDGLSEFEVKRLIRARAAEHAPAVVLLVRDAVDGIRCGEAALLIGRGRRRNLDRAVALLRA